MLYPARAENPPASADPASCSTVPPKITPSKTARAERLDPAARNRLKYAGLGALGIVALAGAVIIAVVLGKGASSPHGSGPPRVKQIGPIALSASGLRSYAADLNQVIYWVGPRKGDRYEFTRTTNNYVYVRYLPRRVQAGTHERKYLFVATYPLAKALASLKASDHGRVLKVAGSKGAIAAVERGTPTNVRVAYPGVAFEIEVYDPNAREARAVAASGALTPVP